jgi:hypothetical protein
MIKTLIAYTTEIDDAGSAASEILAQLSLKSGLLKNSVGIVTCYIDFINTGTVKEICARLPFDVVGINTMYSATSSESGELMLVLTVLTSDDVSFAAAVSAPLRNGGKEELPELYRRAASALPDEPKLILTFPPFMPGMSGDEFVRHLDAASGGVPMFGSQPCDFTTSMRTPFVLFGGEFYADRAAIVLLCGDIKPTFSCTKITDDKILRREAIVTDSDGNILKEINRIPALKYLESLGIASKGQIDGKHLLFPLVIDYNDGVGPLMRTITSHTPEGHLLLSGTIPTDSTLGFGALDAGYIVDSAENMINRAMYRDYDCVFIVSCIIRNLILGFDNMAEIEKIQSLMTDATPFLLTCSGGEFCPVATKDGSLANRFHNVTACLCAF